MRVQYYFSMTAIGFPYGYERSPLHFVRGTGPIFSQYWRIRLLPGRDSNSAGLGPPGGPQHARLCLSSMIS